MTKVSHAQDAKHVVGNEIGHITRLSAVFDGSSGGSGGYVYSATVEGGEMTLIKDKKAK